TPTPPLRATAPKNPAVHTILVLCDGPRHMHLKWWPHRAVQRIDVALARLRSVRRYLISLFYHEEKELLPLRLPLPIHTDRFLHVWQLPVPAGSRGSDSC